MDEDFLLNVLKDLRKVFKASAIFCRNSEGNLLSKPEEVQCRWVEYFNALLDMTEEEDGEMERMEEHLTALENEIVEEKLIPDEGYGDIAILRQRNTWERWDTCGMI
jgi:hypothetical protein